MVQPGQDRSFSVSLTGTNRDQLFAGSERVAHQVSVGASPWTSDELEEIRSLLRAVAAEIEASAAPEDQAPALERLGELEGALTAGPPTARSLSTIEYVRNWFVERLPQVAGVV